MLMERCMQSECAQACTLSPEVRGRQHLERVWRAYHLMDSHVFTDTWPLAGVVLVRDSLQLDGAFMVPWLVQQAVSSGMKVALCLQIPYFACTWS